MKKMSNCLQYVHFSDRSPSEQNLYRIKLYSFLRRLVLEYHNFNKWYQKLFTDDGTLNADREIILCQITDEIAGIIILKRQTDERKICTLRVAKKFQNQGIASRLVELGFEWLEDEKPLITVHKAKIQQFEPLFKKYGFQIEQQMRNYYQVFSTELVYNGALPDKKIFFNHIELNDIQRITYTLIKNNCYSLNRVVNECMMLWWNKVRSI